MPRSGMPGGALDPEIFSKLGELGFMGMRVPEAYGGLELDLATYLLVLEELAWGDASVALGVAIHSGPVTVFFRRYGTEEQKDRYLPRMASGRSWELLPFPSRRPGVTPEP